MFLGAALRGFRTAFRPPDRACSSAGSARLPTPRALASARLPLCSCGYNRAPVDGGARPVPVTIRRGSEIEDASRQLGRLGSAAKARLNVTFISRQGLQEAGIDMGGLMKERVAAAAAHGCLALPPLASRQGLSCLLPCATRCCSPLERAAAAG